MQWFEFPNIDPVALALGPFEIRWYALSYIIGIMGAVWYAKKICARPSLWSNSKNKFAPSDIDDFLIWATLGIILGGRLGYVIFYDPAQFIAHPSRIPMLWEGGMAFHGGMLGVLLAVILFARVRAKSWLSLLDLACLSAPIGLFTGRLANFVNGELFGRVTAHPIGMIFPAGGPLPRHPSQLYEAVLEGLILFVALSIAVWAFKALKKPGLVAGLFGIGYGLARITSEFFREPDAHIGYLALEFTMGMLLSLPMVIIGVIVVIVSVKRKI